MNLCGRSLMLHTGTLSAHSVFAASLLQCLVERLCTRRTIEHFLSHYLEDPYDALEMEQDLAELASTYTAKTRNDVKCRVTTILTSLPVPSSELPGAAPSSSKAQSFHERLLASKTRTKPQTSRVSQAQPTEVERAMTSLEEAAHNNSTEHYWRIRSTSPLSMVKRLFQMTPPTSVDCERAFSSSALLLPKIRSRLGDQTIDQFIFFEAVLLFYRVNKSVCSFFTHSLFLDTGYLRQTIVKTTGYQSVYFGNLLCVLLSLIIHSAAAR